MPNINPWIEPQAPGSYTPLYARPIKVEAPVKRWSLVSENQQTFTLSAASAGSVGGLVTLNTDLVRPTLLGYESSLRGKAENAIPVDEPVAVFHIQPDNEVDALAAMAGILTIFVYPILGGVSNKTGGSKDVSSALLAGNGKLQVQLDTSGIAKAQLQLFNYSTSVQTMRVITQLFGFITLAEEGAGTGKADWSST